MLGLELTARTVVTYHIDETLQSRPDRALSITLVLVVLLKRRRRLLLIPIRIR